MRQPTPIYRIKLNGPEIGQQTWLAKKVTHSMADGGFTAALELEISAGKLNHAAVEALARRHM